MEKDLQPDPAAQFAGLSATGPSCYACAWQVTSRRLVEASELASGTNIATGTTIWGRSDHGRWTTRWMHCQLASGCRSGMLAHPWP